MFIARSVRSRDHCLLPDSGLAPGDGDKRQARVRLWRWRLCVWTAVVILLAGLLGGCHMRAPTCDIDAMPAPLLVEPNNYVDANPPLFTWTYSGECAPDDFRIVIGRTPAQYGDSAYIASIVLDSRVTTAPPATLVGEDGSLTRAYGWTPSEPFADGTYYWRVVAYSGDFHGESSDWGAFQVGEHCARRSLYTIAPRLLYPYYDHTIYATHPTFIWADDNICHLTGFYFVDVSLYSYFPESDTFHSYRWQWPDYEWGWSPGVEGGSLHFCTRYYWRVRTEYSDGEQGPVSEVFFFDIGNVGGAACETGGAPTPNPAAARPVARVIQSANCRSGPTTEYPVLDLLPAGTELPIRARNRSGDSWLVQDVNIGKTCWVYAENVDVVGDVSQVALAEADLPPTETPEPPALSCRDYTDQSSCQNAGCTWDPYFQPNGRCQ